VAVFVTATKKVPEKERFNQIAGFSVQMFLGGNIVAIMKENESTTGRIALEMARAFGSLIRSRRRALNMRQDQLALVTGVGRRFLIELEAGKPSCQLGRSLLVADALGLTPADISPGERSVSVTTPELPEFLEAVEEPDGSPTGLL
jgi:DNA-binding XRE family transcriptional regulator